MVRHIFPPQVSEGKGKKEDRELERREEKGQVIRLKWEKGFQSLDRDSLDLANACLLMK